MGPYGGRTGAVRGPYGGRTGAVRGPYGGCTGPYGLYGVYGVAYGSVRGVQEGVQRLYGSVRGRVQGRTRGLKGILAYKSLWGVQGCRVQERTGGEGLYGAYNGVYLGCTACGRCIDHTRVPKPGSRKATFLGEGVRCVRVHRVR